VTSAHSLNASYVSDLPEKFHDRALDAVGGGWTVSGTFFYRTGLPFTVSDGAATRNIVNGGLNLFNATVLGQPITTVPPDWGAPAVNQACLSALQFSTSETTFGTIRRNSFRGPGYFNTDLGLKKSFRLNERFSFTVGANAYNVLNHPNFANPGFDLSSSTFGTIINAVESPTSPCGAFAAAATDARIVQVMGKITF